MCKGIAIIKARLNSALLEEYALLDRITRRGAAAEEEVRFLFSDPVVQLPVEHYGQTRIYEWGNRSRQGKLPFTGWCEIESIEAGKWRWLQPERVVIPASYGLEKSVWFAINEGLEGIVVRDEQRRPRVYLLTQAASHYYAIMTKHERMPLLIEQQF